MNLPPDPFQSDVDSTSRVKRVRSLSRAQCHDAIERDRRDPYLQATVRKAIIAQLRRIERLEETL